MDTHETKATKTKGIATTLLLSSSVLAGLMAMSLSLPQTASAQSFASCPEGTTSFQGGKCIAQPTVTCEGDQHLNGQGNKCVGGGEGPTTPTRTCPSDEFELQGNRCVAKPGNG